MNQFEAGKLFDLFNRKVVAPDITISEEEVKGHYERNILDFSTPTFVGLKGSIFADRKDAENALDLVRKGADFNWVSANSSGQVSKNDPNVLVFDGRIISEDSVSDELKKYFKDAARGKTFVYTEGDFHYVFAIKKVIASKATPYKDARGQIAKIIFGEKMQTSLADWNLKLKEA